MNVRKTALNRVHREHGGRMVEFAGWELPVQYKSVVEEHHAVRQRAGVFDVSHMGQIEILGPDALAFAQKVTCNDVDRLADGQAQYSAFLTPRGTFIDDIVVYRFGPERIFICVNAATTEKDFAWLKSNESGSIEVRNASDHYSQLAIQGPQAEEVLQKLTETELGNIKFYWFTRGQVAGTEAIISRTGYTGEAGFELYIEPSRAESVWRELFDAGEEVGLLPAGLAARNSLRLEMRYPLYGNDIDETRTPYEAGLGWIVKLNTDFVGRDRLMVQKKQGVDRKLVGFQMVEAGIARDGYTAYIGNREIGPISSGGFSPSLNRSIGLVYLAAEEANPGKTLHIDIRGKLREAVIVETPFYRASKS